MLHFATDHPQAKPDFTFITDRLAVGNVASRAVPGWAAMVSLLATTPWDECYGSPLWDTHVSDGKRDDFCSNFLLPAPHIGNDDFIGGIHLDIQDGDQTLDLAKYLTLLTFFISKTIVDGPVLIHCGAGISRSGAVAVAYFCRYAGMSYSEALSFVKSRRPQVAPANCFAEAIKRWLRLDELAPRGPRVGG